MFFTPKIHLHLGFFMSHSGHYLNDFQWSRVQPFGLLLNFALHCLVDLLPHKWKSHCIVCYLCKMEQSTSQHSAMPVTSLKITKPTVKEYNHRRVLKDHWAPTTLLWAALPTTKPSCPGPHATWRCDCCVAAIGACTRNSASHRQHDLLSRASVAFSMDKPLLGLKFPPNISAKQNSTERCQNFQALLTA